jgi:chemotaxis regulatin CheY-phosphate phosphatase CheZ
MASGDPAPDAAPAQPVEADATTTTEETPEAIEGASGEDAAKKEWPKEAENAVLRRERKIGKLTAQKHQALRDAEFWKQKAEAAETAKTGDKPDRAKFTDDEAYVEAVAEWKSKGTLNDHKVVEAKENAKTSQEAYESTRKEIADESGDAAREAFPDWEETMLKHQTQATPDGKKVIPLSPAARSALLESDHAGSALYSILKDGLLNELNGLPFHRAYALITQHESKALNLVKGSTTNVTKAPAPMTQTRGSPAPGKSVERMTAKEVLAEARA